MVNKMEDEELKIICKEVLKLFPEKVDEYRLGKTGLLGLFAGEVMKKSRGIADPKNIVKLLKEFLD